MAVRIAFDSPPIRFVMPKSEPVADEPRGRRPGQNGDPGGWAPPWPLLAIGRCDRAFIEKHTQGFPYNPKKSARSALEFFITINDY
jgi:hypothetical protein